MDDAHAHPLLPAHTIHTRTRSSTALNLREQQHPSPSHATPKSLPHTRQQRLLHTRNSRFPAQRLSVNGMTVPFPHIIRSVDNDTAYFSGPRFTKREENGPDSDKPPDVTSTSPRSSILHEITSSGAYRVRGIQRRAPIPVFQDPSENRVPIIAGTHSPTVYHDASSDIPSPCHTISSRGSLASMGLREVSINLHRSSPNRDSPHYRSLRSSSRRVSSHSKARFNSEEYIEHIENELQMVKDAMYSPTTNVPWKEKLKKAKDENDRLKKEIEAMKSSFELELQQTVERSTEIEQRLKRRIKDLEDEVEHKQTVILDLEYDREEKGFDQNALEVLKSRIDRLEEEKASLETTNRDMMKRNEVLCQLLAMSPTKTQHNFELPTPRRRSARPMSMIIPRMPSSPAAQTPPSRPQSVLISPALPATDYFPASVASSPLASSSSSIVNNDPLAADDLNSIDSGQGESSSQGTDGTRSRRSTLASCVTNSPPIGHSQSDARPQMPARQPSRRRPRKFMPGSTQLKPLLLPTFTAENGNLPSASPVTSPNRPISIVGDYGLPYLPQWESPPMPQKRMESLVETQPLRPAHDSTDQLPRAFQSLDEVFAEDRGMFCQEVLNEPQDEPAARTYPLQCNTSAGTPHVEAISEVFLAEEELPLDGSWGLGIKDTIPVAIDNRYNATSHRTREDNESSATQPLQMLPSRDTNAGPPQSEASLEALEEHVEIPRPLFSQHLAAGRGPTQSPSYAADDRSPLIPRKRRKASPTSGKSVREKEVSTRHKPPENVTRPTLTPSSIVKRRAEAASSQPTASTSGRQGHNRNRSPLEMLQQRNVGSRPLAAITIQTVYATLSRYTSYVRTFKRDPLALARRVIANAWRSNWAVFGKLSWWVLGLFIGHPRPRPEQRAWDWETYDGESIAHRHCGFQHDRVPTHETPSPTTSDFMKPAADHIGVATKAETISPDPPAPPQTDPEPSWGTSLFLWGKFSVAIMLAVGGAIVKGPGEMLRETEERRRSRSSSVVGIEVDERINCTNPGVGRLPEGGRVLWPDASQRPDDMRAPGTTRKARSFSSPTPPVRRQPDDPLPSSQGPANGDSSSEVPINAADKRCVEEYDPSSAVNETLKPARTERKGLGSLFEPPSGQEQKCSTAGKSSANISNSMDHEIEASVQHLPENG